MITSCVDKSEEKPVDGELKRTILKLCGMRVKPAVFVCVSKLDDATHKICLVSDQRGLRVEGMCIELEVVTGAEEHDLICDQVGRKLLQYAKYSDSDDVIDFWRKY